MITDHLMGTGPRNESRNKSQTEGNHGVAGTSATLVLHRDGVNVPEQSVVIERNMRGEGSERETPGRIMPRSLDHPSPWGTNRMRGGQMTQVKYSTPESGMYLHMSVGCDGFRSYATAVLVS